MQLYTVYIHTTPNNKKYVGITCQDVFQRWGSGGKGYYDIRRTSQLPFWNAIQKYGWDNIQHEIVAYELTKDEACSLEKRLIKQYKSNDRAFGYNLTEGGEGVCGFTHSAETRQKLSKSLKGRIIPEEQRKKISGALTGRPNTWQSGVPLSESVKKKISASLQGHLVSDETREKLRQANTGKHHSDETKKKLSENNRMREPEIRKKVSESLKKSGPERAKKRLETIKSRYPEGLKQPEESNKKRSDALKGIPKSEKTKEKMRKPKSPEAVENMKKAQRLRREAEKLGLTYKEYIEMVGGSGK